MGNLTGPEGQQGSEPRPRSQSTSAGTPRSTGGADPHRQPQPQPKPTLLESSSAPSIALAASSSAPPGQSLRPPSPRSVPPPSPRTPRQQPTSPPALQDFRAPTLATIPTPGSSQSTGPPSCPAPAPPDQHQPDEQPPPQPDSPANDDVDDDDDIWKLAANAAAAAADADPVADEASGLEILDALAELRDSVGESGDIDVKSALVEIAQASHLAVAGLVARPASPPAADDGAETPAASVPAPALPTTEDDLSAPAQLDSEGSTSPAASQPDADAADLTVAAPSQPEQPPADDEDLTAQVEQPPADAEDLTVAAAAASQPANEETTEDLMAALSQLGDAGSSSPADNGGETTEDLMAALSQLGDGASSAASDNNNDETTEDLMAALSQLGDAGSPLPADKQSNDETTEDLMAALSQLGDGSSSTASSNNNDDETTEDLMAALSQLGQPGTASEPSNDETTEDLMAALSQLGDGSSSSSSSATNNEDETTEDLMAALSQLGDGGSSATVDDNDNDETTEDLMAALSQLGNETTPAPADSDDLMAALSQLGDGGNKDNNADARAALAELDDSASRADGQQTTDDADAGSAESTQDLMALLDGFSARPKKIKSSKSLLPLKSDTFLSTTWDAPEAADSGVEIPDEFAAAFAKHEESKGRRKMDVGRIGRGGPRSRTKKVSKPDITEFAPMTSLEDSQWSLSPSAPPVLKKPSPVKAANPDWMSALFGGPNATTASDDQAAGADDSPPSTSLPAGGLLRDWSVKEDINKPGLRRSKKRPIKGNKHGKKPLQMEDFNFCTYPWLGDASRAMFCVFDGHVDKDCGQALVTAWPLTWKKVTAGLDFKQVVDLSDYLKKAFLTVDQELKEHEYCGSTMTVVMIWEGPNKRRYVQSANVGDSLAFLCRARRAIDLSEVHCVREPNEAQRLREAGSSVNEGATRINGLSVTRAIGDHFVKEVFPGFTAEPFVSPSYALGDDDTHIVLASDGLWDVITGQEAVDAVLQESTANRMSSSLLQIALNSKKCNDNVTVCAIVL